MTSPGPDGHVPDHYAAAEAHGTFWEAREAAQDAPESDDGASVGLRHVGGVLGADGWEFDAETLEWLEGLG